MNGGSTNSVSLIAAVWNERPILPHWINMLFDKKEGDIEILWWMEEVPMEVGNGFKIKNRSKFFDLTKGELLNFITVLKKLLVQFYILFRSACSGHAFLMYRKCGRGFCFDTSILDDI